MQWKEAITCGQSEFSLDEKPIFISSPGFPKIAMTDSIQNLPPPPAYDEIDKTTEYFPAGPGGARFQQNQFHPPPPFDPPSNVSTQVIILEHRAITEPDYLTPRQKLILIILMFIPITWPFLGILLMILACKGDQNGKFMRRPFIHGLFLINLTLNGQREARFPMTGKATNSLFSKRSWKHVRTALTAWPKRCSQC
ncbi:unnamed protein product, partial [Mesorhabditis belari]|uniref:Uncharacterized protein n=1 Tax=Mesorhabditis belari TaxID=2138241 RepID=A0AAF3EN32_9BILA